MISTHYSRYNGIGNTFILINGLSHAIDLDKIKKNTPRLCNPTTGIGADGLIIASSSDHADPYQL